MGADSEKMKKKWIDIIRLCMVSLIIVAQVVASFLVVVALIKSGIVGGGIIAVVIGALVTLLAINVVFLIIRRKTALAGQIICLVLATLCIVCSIIALRYVNSFNGFLDKVTERKVEIKSYSVAVLNNSTITDVTELNGKNVGFLGSDKKSDVAAEKLGEIVAVSPDYYDDVTMLFDVLNGGLAEAIVMESDRFEMFKTINSDNKAQSENVVSDSGSRNTENEKRLTELVESLRVIYSYQIELDENTTVITQKSATEPFILYISGSDSREGIKATARSDVNIVAVINPISSKILLASIPRDTYVQLHDTVGLKDKLTHAGMYSVDMSKTTIEDFLGITIDHTLKVSFDTVVRVVDQLDGITINSDKAMNLKVEWKNKYCYYDEGVQIVDGDCALRFARERKSYSSGDKHRGENQQEVLTGIINKLTGSKEYLLKAPEILNIAADSFETSLSRDDITNFIRKQLAESINWQIESISVDGEYVYEPTYSMGADLPLCVMIPYEDSLAEVIEKIENYLK